MIIFCKHLPVKCVIQLSVEVVVGVEEAAVSCMAIKADV